MQLKHKKFNLQVSLKSDAHTITQTDTMRFFHAFTLVDKGSVLQEDLKVQLQLLHYGPHLSVCSVI